MADFNEAAQSAYIHSPLDVSGVHWHDRFCPVCQSQCLVDETGDIWCSNFDCDYIDQAGLKNNADHD